MELDVEPAAAGFQPTPLLGGSWTAARIPSGTVVDVGAYFSGRTGAHRLHLKADLDAFSPNLDRLIRSITPEHTQKWSAFAESAGLQIDGTFIACAAQFTAVMMDRFPVQPESVGLRDAMYVRGVESGVPPKLSEVYEQGLMMCSEICLIAQEFLHRMGVEARYVSGVKVTGMDPNNEWQDVGAHAYLMVDDPSGALIYDAPSAQRAQGVWAPRIYRPQGDFESVLRSNGEARFAQCTDIIFGMDRYFGIGDPEDFIINRRCQR